jgi:hypothetical protein
MKIGKNATYIHYKDHNLNVALNAATILKNQGFYERKSDTCTEKGNFKQLCPTRSFVLILSQFAGHPDVMEISVEHQEKLFFFYIILTINNTA